ncbi:MAG: phosphomannomutase/phosphoglucomutase, partial [Alphaproteobacteria bacterium]|nr:phosphomannomutase/phosphoglucomutase [Alphaproteobacteria bacterium]
MADHTEIRSNTEAFEREALIAESGFREYDARWLYPEQLNLRGAQRLGEGLGTLLHDLSPAASPAVVVGHDYRAYSAAIKHALTIGLLSSGCHVKDIGLALSPVAYFAQFELDFPAVAMVTASHNENGWTGVKMGASRPLTFGPELMGRLKDIVLKGKARGCGGGSYVYVEDMKERYIADLARGGKLKRRLKVVVACGNGTAGVYAPEALAAVGCDVIPMDCTPDYTFPRCNPNPEDMEMLRALSERVKETGADIGFAFDGDGDRCGIVDDTGTEIFADKIGVLLARDLAAVRARTVFVADVKSTGLYGTDPVLKARNATTDYWKTGHSYIKSRVAALGAIAGFEKSGHFFFSAPLGRGYDDGILSAIMVCRMLDRCVDKTLSQLRAGLPMTWSSPTMSPFCADDQK